MRMIVPLEVNSANQNVDHNEQQRARRAGLARETGAYNAFAPAVRK
jgi:hypothetical protein